MKRLYTILSIAIGAATLLLTACEFHWDYFDWTITPETEIVEIPKEGGIYHLRAFEREEVATTRMIENNMYKCCRYRLIMGDIVGEPTHLDYIPIDFEVPANESGTERNVTLEISKSKEFHCTDEQMFGSICDEADLSDDNWEEWQAVWFGVQEG